MSQVSIPVDMMDDSSLHHRVTPQSIRDEVLRMLRGHLYTELTFEELTQVVEPEEEKGARRRPKGRMLEHDYCPVFELRHVRDMRWNEASVMAGGPKLGLWRASLEQRYQRALANLEQEQPNCVWKLVACKVMRTNRRRVISYEASDGGVANGTAAMFAVMQETNYDNPRAVRVLPSFAQREEPDVLWNVPLVFADIAKAELVDPQLAAHLNGVEGPMTQYARTRRLGHMPPNLRRNRKWAIELMQEFRDSFDPIESDLAPLPPRFTEGQLTAARMLREEGQPMALIAQMLGAPVEEVSKALA